MKALNIFFPAMMTALAFAAQRLMVRKLCLALCLLTLTTVPAMAMVKGKMINLRGVNKITGEILETKTAVGEEKRIGKLRVKVLACFKPDKNENHTAAGFLQIWDNGKSLNTNLDDGITVKSRNAAGEAEVFSGWMFADNPSLNALDHPIYDIWVTGCE